MHNNEFEKRVEHKLEELKFTPSDAVWQKVEVQIRERKRRRRFFFWWLPAMVLCTGIAGWFIYSLETGNDKTSAITIEKKAEPSAAPENNDAVKSMVPVAESKQDDEERNEQPVTANTVQKKQTPAVTAKIKVTEPVVNDHLLINQKRKNIKEQTDQPVTKEEQQVTPQAINPVVAIAQPVITDNPVIEKKQDSAIAVKQDEQTREKRPVITDSPAISINVVPAIANEPVIIKKKKIELDVVFRAGMADISRFSEGFKLKMGGRLYASPGTNSPGFPSQSPPSKAKSSAGFTAGIQVNRPVSKRSALSIGLAYSYYSSSHKTGNTVYFPAQFSSNVGTSVVNSYARVGNTTTYRDNYHFIEVPLAYHLQMNKVARRPVFFNGGIAYSYLVGSNAQYYYRATGAYYYDRMLFNRSQLQLRTGISMGLVKNMNYPLQLGLQYQYNISGQWKNALELNQHLSFTGIQLSWRLNNK